MYQQMRACQTVEYGLPAFVMYFQCGCGTSPEGDTSQLPQGGDNDHIPILVLVHAEEERR